MAKKNDITLVTAFFDIGRDTWRNPTFQRSADFYVDSFLTYLQYPYKMVCFIDEKYMDKIYTVYEKSIYKNKQFIPINREWLNNNIHAWSNIEKDRQILSSTNFKDFLSKRLEFIYPNGIPDTNVVDYLCPENLYPEYNIVNHSKIDFIMYAINNGLISTEFTGWSDFGYFSTFHKDGTPLPHSTIDTEKLDKHKVAICLRRNIAEKDKDMLFTLLTATELFVGAFYAGPTRIMQEFQELYHNSVNEMYENGVSDDDQHVYIRCHMRNPTFFDMHIFEKEWPKALVYFQ
jgi:hypothetical protein